MPKVGYNDPRVSKLYGGNAKTVRLKTKGQTVKFVLGNETPTMYGLHWIDKKPFACPRVNDDTSCPRCQEGFAMLSDLKEMELDKESKEYKAIKKKAMDKLPQISFYYPVLVSGGGVVDPGTYLLEVTKTVYERFGALKEKGKDLLGLVWDLTRTEKPGSYYSLDDVGVAPELSAEDLEELGKIGEMDIDGSMNYASIETVYGADGKRVTEDDAEFEDFAKSAEDSEATNSEPPF